MPKPTDYDKTHLRNMAAIGTRIDRIFKKAAEEAARIGVSIKSTLPEDKIFSFDDYPATRKQIERLMGALRESMETTIVNGVRSAWTLSNNKNNALVARVFGDNVRRLSKEQERRYYSTNGAALDVFLKRKAQGLGLSERVWRYADAFKSEIEMGLDLGIRTGEDAACMARSLKQYLRNPDKLFRRVRDQHGNLRLSKAAKAYHPGRGVYRSSYRNARRLAVTETNMAYHTADHLRWQQMDFVVGIEIRLSGNHTVNGLPLTDICDELAGRYPKDFKFTGWHPHCRCHAVTVLKTEKEMAEDTQRILRGEEPLSGSVNEVRRVPAAFTNWVEDNRDRIEAAEANGTVPYFIGDNRDTVKRILEGGGSESKPKEKKSREDNQQSTHTPLTEQQKQRRTEIKDIMTSRENNVYTSPLFDSPISLPNKSIKEWLNQPHYAVDDKNESLLNLQAILDGCSKKIEIPIKPKYHESVSAAYALPITIKDRESWIIIHVMKWGEVKIHGISDDARIFNK